MHINVKARHTNMTIHEYWSDIDLFYLQFGWLILLWIDKGDEPRQNNKKTPHGLCVRAMKPPLAFNADTLCTRDASAPKFYSLERDRWEKVPNTCKLLNSLSQSRHFFRMASSKGKKLEYCICFRVRCSLAVVHSKFNRLLCSEANA